MPPGGDDELFKSVAMTGNDGKDDVYVDDDDVDENRWFRRQ